jgi:hypothetical protein
MWQASEALRAALAAEHEMTTEVWCVRGPTAEQIPVIKVDVAATFGTQGGRSASLRVDYGVIADGWLDPLQDEVLIRVGVSGVGSIPLFQGRVNAVDDDDNGDVNVVLMSRGEEIIRAAFEAPFASQPRALTTQEMIRVVQSVNPAWPVRTAVDMDAEVPAAAWEDDPGEALDSLAAGINAVWMPDRTGGFEVFTNPFTLSTAPQPAIILRDGENGILVHVRHTSSRENISNSVTVVVERTDGAAPIRVTVRDTDPGSPTRWGGPFGKQNEVIKTQLPLNRETATAIAERRLEQSLALARSWSLTLPPGIGNLLDPGDMVAVWYRNEVTAQVVESVTYAPTAESTVVTATRVLRTVTPIPDV